MAHFTMFEFKLASTNIQYFSTPVLDFKKRVFTWPFTSLLGSSDTQCPREPSGKQSHGKHGSSELGRTPLGRYQPVSHFSQLIPVVCFWIKMKYYINRQYIGIRHERISPSNRIGLSLHFTINLIFLSWNDMWIGEPGAKHESLKSVPHIIPTEKLLEFEHLFGFFSFDKIRKAHILQNSNSV